MAANQLYDYLLNGNIKNSVNLPDTSLSRMGVCRLCVIHRNVPRMITRILDFISDRNINVEHMINKPRDKYCVYDRRPRREHRRGHRGQHPRDG